MINNERLSGILLHPTSLPSPYGIGDLGDEAYAFIDFLARAGQHLWQVLPLTHTGFGDSPYQSFSAFAGQPLLIDPRHLIRLGLIGGWELTDCPIADPSHVDYGQVIPWKEKVLALAYSRFPQKRHEIPGMDQSFQEFCESNRYWLDDYALFMACKKLHHGADWLHWPDEYRCPTLEFKAGLFKSMHEDIEYYRFTSGNESKNMQMTTVSASSVISRFLYLWTAPMCGRTSICSNWTPKGIRLA